MANSLKEKLIGTWSLVSFESEGPDGIITYPLGKDAQGSIMYAADGYVSVNIMQTGRTGFVDRSLYQNKLLKYLDLPYLAYSGRFVLDESRPSVTHIVEVSIYPDWLGAEQYRIIKWLGDDLQLGSDGPIGPDQNWFRLHWKRKQQF